MVGLPLICLMVDQPFFEYQVFLLTSCTVYTWTTCSEQQNYHLPPSVLIFLVLQCSTTSTMSTLGMTPFKYQISYFFLFQQQNWMFTTVVDMRMLQPSTNSYHTISIHEWIQVVNSWTFVQFNTAFFHVHSINFLLKSSFLNHSHDFFFNGLKIMVAVICGMIWWSYVW